MLDHGGCLLHSGNECLQCLPRNREPSRTGLFKDRRAVDGRWGNGGPQSLSFLESLLGPDLVPLAMVILIDIAMSGDNAIIIGLAAAGLPAEQRRKAIFYGVMAAAVIRIVFAVTVVYLLAIIGLLLAGGLLLLWVCWHMWKDLRRDSTQVPEDETAAEGKPTKTLRQAMTTIIIADVSMSLDNVLAVAGAARENVAVLVFGLALSVALMGFAANYLAKLLERHKWIGYLGLVIIAYVAADMIWRGSLEIQAQVLS